MKTRKQWFEQFPEPYRAQAIKNTGVAPLFALFPTAKAAFFAAFPWAMSPQGFNYWYEFYKTFTDELPNTCNG